MCDESLEVAGLPAREVDTALRRALAGLDRLHRGAVLCFLELQSRRLYRELGYSSLHHYATAALGFSPRRTAQFLRLAETFGRLPLLCAAVRQAQVEWTKALVVASIATERTEAVWLAEARRLSRPDLARRAAQVRARAREALAARTFELSTRPAVLPPCPPSPAPPPYAPPLPPPDAPRGAPAPSCASPPLPAAPAPSSPAPALAPIWAAARPPASAALPADLPLHVTLRFTSLQYARWATQLERLRKGAWSGSAALPAIATREELVLAALDELLAAAASPGHTSTGGGPSYQIVLYRCQECGAGRVATPLGDRAVPPASVAAAACDARVLAPGGRNEATIPAAMRRVVMARDGHRCQATGCGRTRFLEVHHRRPRVQGGANVPANLITLCSACHRLRHEREAAAS